MLHTGAMPHKFDLVSTKEAMEILGYRNPSSVARLVYEGKLAPAYMSGDKRHTYAFDRAVVEALAAARIAKAAS
jgi:predicted ATPase